MPTPMAVGCASRLTTATLAASWSALTGTAPGQACSGLGAAERVGDSWHDLRRKKGNGKGCSRERPP
jgi:hypothetical protein